MGAAAVKLKGDVDNFGRDGFAKEGGRLFLVLRGWEA